jgi:multicomponent Na+:H+ antiporter subunit E
MQIFAIHVTISMNIFSEVAMQYIKKRYKLFLFILIFWFLINWNFRIETIFFGLLTSLIVTIASKGVLYDTKGFRYQGIKLHRIIIYIFFLFIEIFKSTFTYVLAVISGNYEPVLFTIELDLLDPVQVGIVANSITLTPGTISVDVIGNSILVMTLAKQGTDPKDLEKPIRDHFEWLLKNSGGKKHA